MSDSQPQPVRPDRETDYDAWVESLTFAEYYEHFGEPKGFDPDVAPGGHDERAFDA